MTWISRNAVLAATLWSLSAGGVAADEVNLDSQGRPEGESRQEVNLDSQGRPERPVPEPGAALVFGAGLLIAVGLARRLR